MYNASVTISLLPLATFKRFHSNGNVCYNANTTLMCGGLEWLKLCVSNIKVCK